MWNLFIITTTFTVVFCSTIRSADKAPLMVLNDGNSIPSFGLGTWLGVDGKGGVNKVTDNSVEIAVEDAIDAGYRHIDTAHVYDTEEQVGRAVNKKIKDGVVTRKELFITTKLWNDKHAKEDVVPALKESLAKLNLDYVDLYLIHFPYSLYPNGSLSEIDYLETWQGMIEAKESGLTKSIGVSNFNIEFIQRLIDVTGVKPAVLQVEVNLNLQQDQLRQYARDNDIVVVGYTPFGSLFPSKPLFLTVMPSVPLSEPPPPRVDDPELVAIANKYGKTVPQIVLRYLLDLDVAQIPKTTKKERLIENINIFDFELSPEDKKVLKSYDNGYRSLDVPIYKGSQYYPFRN